MQTLREPDSDKGEYWFPFMGNTECGCTCFDIRVDKGNIVCCPIKDTQIWKLCEKHERMLADMLSC